jgi:hypothetical protein
MYQHWLDLMSGKPWSEIIELKRQREQGTAVAGRSPA